MKIATIVGIVLCLLSSAALAGDFCLPVTTLNLLPHHTSHVCRSNAVALQDKKLDFGSREGPLSAYITNPSVTLETCKQYLELVGVGQLSPSRMEAWTEYSIYMQTCGTLFAVARAQHATKSYLGENPLDLKQLPPTVLFNGLPNYAVEELDASFARGESAEEFIESQEKADPNFKRAEFFAGWEITLLARADFDGDGIEEALVSWSASSTSAEDHYFAYHIGLLKRNSPTAPTKWIDFREFKWPPPVK